MVGDPYYMAPEQISGQGYGFGVDYWALGILVYAMLHIETPFAKNTTETQVTPLFSWRSSLVVGYTIVLLSEVAIHTFHFGQ